MRRYQKVLIALVALLALPIVVLRTFSHSTLPAPIASEPITSPAFIGRPATAKPIDVSFAEHPYLAPGNVSTIHSGGYNSDVHLPSGPLGKNPQIVTRKGSAYLGGMCATTVFGKQDLLITYCGTLTGVDFRLLKPRTLELLARYELPPRPSTFASLVTLNADLMMSDTSGGSYFYLDREGFVVFADSAQIVQRLGHRQNSSGEWEFYLAESWDLSDYVPLDCLAPTNWFPDGVCDPITSVTPDYAGLIWWVTRKGRIGTLNAETNEVRIILLEGEEIQNSFAAAADGVFIVSDHAMYALKANADGIPEILWREPYDRGTVRKPGLATQGSGTTPTLIGDDYVTIADNADDQVNLLVLHRAPEFVGQRLICRVPLFNKGRSATEISMIAYNRTIIIENTFGYWNAIQQKEWDDVVGGISRIDIREDESGCDVKWKSPERSPSGVGKLSTGNGLVYFYTFTPQPNGENAWYFTALDAENGTTVFKILTGAGRNFDVNWGPLTIGPDGTAYAPAINGFIAIWDGA